MTIPQPRWTPAAWIAGAVLLAGGCVGDTVTPDPLAPPATPQLLVAEVTWTELDPLPGEANASAFAVNSSGQAFGSSGNRPVVWENGAPTELENLEGATFVTPRAINDAGQATGHVHVDDLPRAVLWEEGTIIELGALPGHDWAVVGGISNAGHVVGTSTAGSLFSGGTGFLWHEGSMTELPPLPGDQSSAALFVNSAGVAVGESWNADDDVLRWVLWKDGEAVEIDPWLSHELFILEGISDEGEVVFSGAGTGGGVFVWHDGDLTQLPSPDEEADWSAARAVSPGGLILGIFSGPCCSGFEFGIWHDTDFTRFDPPPSMGCWDVADGGWVVCRGDGSVVGKVQLGADSEGIAGVVAFFDEAIANGTLEGAGPGNSGARRAQALRSMLVEAGSLLEERGLDPACGALNQVLRRTDGSPRPPDFVQGPAAPQLADQVRAAMHDLGC